MSLFSPSVKQGKKTFFKLWCINDHLNSQWTQLCFYVVSYPVSSEFRIILEMRFIC